MPVDRDAPLRFLRAAFLPDDWIAVLLKAHGTGEVVQRVGPVAMVLDARFQSWLRFKNAHRFDVFVSVNALTHGRRSRTRESVSAVRHVFLDADRDAERVLRAIERRPDLPTPSFIVRSSAGRAHVLWRVGGLSVERAEALQKHLARELGTDMAATSASQMTRLPGFFNHKYSAHPLVAVEHKARPATYDGHQFPAVPASPGWNASRPSTQPARQGVPVLERARRYLAATPPAIQGRNGDAKTFRVCCALFRRFDLTDRQVLPLLRDWNLRCVPHWSDRQLIAKVKAARRATSRGSLLLGPIITTAAMSRLWEMACG